MASKTEQRIESAEARLKQLKVKSAREKARARTSQSRTARRDEIRRRFLVGAVVLARVEKGLLAESVLQGWMDGSLHRADDRALFGLQNS